MGAKILDDPPLFLTHKTRRFPFGSPDPSGPYFTGAAVCHSFMVIISPQTRPKHPPPTPTPPQPLVYRRAPVYGLMVIRPARIRGSLRANCWREPEPEASETDGNQMSPPGLFPPAWVDPISHEPCGGGGEGGDTTRHFCRWCVCVYRGSVYAYVCVLRRRCRVAVLCADPGPRSHRLHLAREKRSASCRRPSVRCTQTCARTRKSIVVHSIPAVCRRAYGDVRSCRFARASAALLRRT